jgi:hypothetical protein
MNIYKKETHVELYNKKEILSAKKKPTILIDKIDHQLYQAYIRDF